MNEYEKLVPVELRGYIDGIVELARNNIERDGVLAPVAFVGTIGGNITVIGGLAYIEKDDAAKMIRKAAKQTKADFVLHVDEGWLKHATSKAEVDALKENHGQVRDMPGRVDVVMFSLETRMGQFFDAPVRQPHGETYTFGELKMQLMPDAEGRFMGLLPPLGKGH